MPLLDVVFLLLTFFIYAMAVMVRVDALEVGLAPVAGPTGTGGDVQHVLRIEPNGTYNYNDNPLPPEQLNALLQQLADDPDRPRLFVALTNQPTPDTDRAPAMWDVLQRIQAAGLNNVAIVGRPTE